MQDMIVEKHLFLSEFQQTCFVVTFILLLLQYLSKSIVVDGHRFSELSLHVSLFILMHESSVCYHMNERLRSDVVRSI